jgi:serine/threonine-protein kinase
MHFGRDSLVTHRHSSLSTEVNMYSPSSPHSCDSERVQAVHSPDSSPCILGSKYVLVRPLGTGGMGAVWLARNQSTGGEVAVKFLVAGAEDSEELASRFRREAYVTASLTHRNVVRVFDFVESAPGGALVLVMEFLHGAALDEHLKVNGRLTPAQTLEIALPLLAGLMHAHSRGIVHRDLKPQNIFLARDPDGFITPKLLDFGISKVRGPDAVAVTAEGEILGTRSYMSPEQACGSDVDARSDVFSMGVVLYEMLSGHNPFEGEAREVLPAILMREPPALVGIPGALAAVVMRALSKEAPRRYANAGELAQALEAAMCAPPTHTIRMPRPKPGVRSKSATRALGTLQIERRARQLKRALAFASTLVGASLVCVIVSTSRCDVGSTRSAEALPARQARHPSAEERILVRHGPDAASSQAGPRVRPRALEDPSRGVWPDIQGVWPEPGF